MGQRLGMTHVTTDGEAENPPSRGPARSHYQRGSDHSSSVWVSELTRHHPPESGDPLSDQAVRESFALQGSEARAGQLLQLVHDLPARSVLAPLLDPPDQRFVEQLPGHGDDGRQLRELGRSSELADENGRGERARER